MPFPITCPACQTTSPCPDQFEGRKVKCKKCAQAFVARKPGNEEADIVDDAEVFDDAEVVDEPAPKPKPKAPPQRLADEDDDEPRVKKKPARRDDDEDDEDDAPRSKKKRQAQPEPLSPLVWVMMAVVGLGLMGGGGGFAYWAVSEKKVTSPQAFAPMPNDGKGPVTPKGGPGPIGPAPNNNPTVGWVDKRDADTKYSVKFPTAPIEQVQDAPNPEGPPVKMRLFQAVIPAQQAVFVSLGMNIPAGEANLPSEQLFDLMLGGMVGRLAGKATEVGRRDLKYQNYPSREVEFTTAPGGRMLVRMVHANNRIFVLLGNEPGEAPTQRMKAFLDSLKIE